MTAAVVDAAPAHASESPGPDPTTEAGHSEDDLVSAILLCAVLAEHAPTLASATGSATPDEVDYHGQARDRLYRLVRLRLMHDSHEQVLAWRSRVGGTLQGWVVRWDAARRVAATYWPDLPGVEAVPDLYTLDDDGWAAATVEIPTQPS